MPEDENVSIVATIITGLIGVYSYLSGNIFLQWIGSILFGAFLTFFVQTRLQNRAEKNKIRKQNIEKIFAPLYLEIRDIRRKLLDFPESLNVVIGFSSEHNAIEELYSWRDSWKEISNSYMRFVLGDEIEQDIRTFYNGIDRLNDRVKDARSYIDTRIRFFFESTFLTSIRKPSTLSRGGVTAGFYLDYERKFQNSSSIRDYSAYLLKGINPLDDFLQFDDFSIDSCRIEYWIDKESAGSSSEKKQDISLEEHFTEFNSFIEAVLCDVGLNPEIVEIREMSGELLIQSKELETTLLKHISRYYPVEKI